MSYWKFGEKEVKITSDTTKQYLQKYQNIFQVNKVSDYTIEMLARPAHWLSLCHYNDQPLHLDDFQVGVVNSYGRYNMGVKSRQMGWSTICVAGRAVAKSHMIKGHRSLIVSYNLAEAKEKIKLVKMLSDGVPARFQVKLAKDNALGVEYENHSEIMSVFSTRGYQNADVYLDEFAFFPDQAKSYKDTVPMIRRNPDKQLFIGSTPFGKLGLFYDIFSRAGNKYKNYDRFLWYWWDSPFYCKDVAGARKDAHMLTTPCRLEKYGTEAILELYEALGDIEAFQQEFEGYFFDEATSFFPYDLITKRMRFFDEELQAVLPKNLEEIGRHTKGRLYCGYDVGRVRNASEFFVFDLRKDALCNKFIHLYNETFDNTEFHIQKEYLRNFINTYQRLIGAVAIDRSKIGMNMSEDLKKEFPRIIEPVEFTNSSKAEMANTTKIFFTDGIIELQPDKDLMMQIHSIKQMITPMKNVRYDVERNEKHHADKFWAIALACYAANMDNRLKPEIYIVGRKV